MSPSSGTPAPHSPADTQVPHRTFSGAGSFCRRQDMEKGPPGGGPFSFSMFVRLRPTLPHRHQCSTIGAEGLSFRVRNGTGRFPFAMTAETLWRYLVVDCSLTVSRELHSGR